MDSKELLELKNVSVRYDESVILENVNFKINPEEFVSIVGKSGAGKTTLLNAICGFISYTGDIQSPKDRGMVFQNYSIFPWMTVSQNIEFGLDNLSKEKKRRIVQYYLRLTDLQQHSAKYPAELSGGEIQRVAIARAFAPQPELVLMDEPYGALDIHTRDKMQNWLLDLWKKEKKTVLFVTHYIDEAILLSDRILVVRDRNIQEFKVDLPRPRNTNLKFEKNYLDLKKGIINCIN